MPSHSLNAETNLNLTFPLPYRVLFLVGLGILGWATNLHGLDFSGIDPISAFNLWSEGQKARIASRQMPHGNLVITSTPYMAIYKIFFVYMAFCIASWTIYRSCTKGDDVLVDAFGYIPLVTILVIIIFLVCPMSVPLKYEREKFLNALGRCVLPSSHSPIEFSDVVFADIATSFAKVFGDFWLSALMLLPGNTLLAAPPEEGWQRWILPTIMSFPYLLRFRQCLIEYSSPPNATRRPLYNAIKYATAFPVIFLSAAQKGPSRLENRLHGDGFSIQYWPGTFRLWLIATIINSSYSFWWDVTNDWGLDLLQKGQRQTESVHRRTPPRQLLLPRLQFHSHTSPLGRTSNDSAAPDISTEGQRQSNQATGTGTRPHPWGLRSVLLFPLPVYPLLVFLNLILRMTWSIKLSSHLYSVTDGSAGIFWLEVAEILRRWLWVFLRVEWELIKGAQNGTSKGRANSNGADPQYEMVPTSSEDQILFHA
ncbi:hypothetical protein AGABI1DRAFT_119253 [Agaricus bisporus var. burnettii JB137-S8]|uniref:EXS domain-containing protein n=1 Tax=Agaricus bisporus var. burnettii (strain JB137-S8 / ATCC MYA-4627 / FGSC 10392) TaxID=597362 RepID=K5W1L4_AGABU|nr:uncharacterized protein AGABI1DRAFT_119253 [Agaricus bisporus var. burnettii JB137-S8]EKM80664.1 hypothetical protein AGABI1DRAFT_119253 [Agaricus bisporus var. burnettii JB137-S8]